MCCFVNNQDRVKKCWLVAGWPQHDRLQLNYFTFQVKWKNRQASQTIRHRGIHIEVTSKVIRQNICEFTRNLACQFLKCLRVYSTSLDLPFFC